MSFAVDPPPVVSLPVTGSDRRFPVQNLFCVGRNYADHAVEMGGDPNREPPFFFIKPAWAILGDGGVMEYPAFSDDVHHEVELVVAIGKGGRNIAPEDAMDHVFGYAVGIDMTRRDLQQQAKDTSRPWEAGKSFVHAAPCSDVCRAAEAGDVNEAGITLSINGETRQDGRVNQMIWKIPEVIVRLSELFALQPGDLIFTGTPAGVGPIERGDRITASVDGVGQLNIEVAA